MKKILLTGVNGQVGHALQAMLTNAEVVATDVETLDLTNVTAIRDFVQATQPDLIINPAAYTAVDKAETEAALAYAVNAVAPGILAEEAAKLGAAMIHFSTDYVYDGYQSTHYVETDVPNPVSVYGKSKLAGEQAVQAAGIPHLILRTSWVYGSFGKNFLKTILRLAGERESLRIVADQYGAPTTDLSIARAVCELVDVWQPQDATQTGIYHLVNAGETSWHGFAEAIVAQYRSIADSKHWPALSVREIQAIASAEYPTPAARPLNSRLSTAKLARQFGVQLPDWPLALAEVMRDMP
ncbi:MAG TPA: dTDP-4-dehydrorhamnose reductase [Methylophilus sp.]